MTPETLIKALLKLPAETPVILQIGSVQSRPGFHLTEIKLAQITSLDCGANRHEWSEVVLQMLDGSGGEQMNAGKLASILKRGDSALDGIKDLPLLIEFSPGNSALQRHEINEVAESEGRVTLVLSGTEALCKPSKAFVQKAVQDAGCCGGPVQKQTACCA